MNSYNTHQFTINSIVNNLKTDNIFIDTIISLVVFYIFNKMITKMDYYFRNLNIYDLYNLISRKKKYSIVHTLSIKNYDPPAIALTIRFKAVCHYLTSTINTSKNKDIYRLSETSTKQINYLVDQKRPFKITDDIYCSIHKSYKSFKDNDGQVETEKYELELYSYKNMEIIHQFIKECVKEYNRTKNTEIQELHYFNYIKSDEKYAMYEDYIFQSNKRMDNIFFEQKDELIKCIDYFRDNKKWYSDKGIPHTLGLLFYGVPGCGKTSTIKAIANYLDRHIVNVPLSKIEYADELRNIFYNAEIEEYDIVNEKRIYVFEDIDCLSDIIKKRESIDDKKSESKKDDDKKDELIEMLSEQMNPNRRYKKKTTKSDGKEPLTLSFILNLFDGVLEQNGRIIILTTNHIDNIDPALIRTGRIDYKIEFKKASDTIIKQILSHFYDVSIETLEKYQFTDYQHSISDVMNFCQMNKMNIDKAIELLL